MHGHLDRAMLSNCLAEAADLLRQHPDIDISVWDLAGITGFDPGNAAYAIQWSREHCTGIQKCVVVTRNQTIAGLAWVGQVMIPHTRVHVASRREDALALLDEFARARRRSAA